jgi:hypothetical protein
MEKQGTISSCIGISEKDWDVTEELAERRLKEDDLISDALMLSAKEIKQEEFGENFEISHFEKRLLVAAFIIGVNHGRSGIISKIQEDPSKMMALLLLANSKE